MIVPATLFVLLLLNVFPISRATASQQSAAGTRLWRLTPGPPLEREMSKGETHAYEIAADAGQYVRIVVEQRGIDVHLAVIGPGGETLAQSIGPDTVSGSEPVSFISDSAGNYRLEVRPAGKSNSAGAYKIKVDQQRPAEGADRTRIAGERLFMEGMVLNQAGTAESLKNALLKYEDALRLFRQIGDRRNETEALSGLGYTHEQLAASSRAAEFYRQGLTIAQQMRFRDLEARLLNNLGVQHGRQGRNKQAIEYFEQALEASRAAGEHETEAVTLASIGGIHLMSGEIDKARDCFSQALLKRNITGDVYGVGLALHNLGVIYSHFGEPQKALDHYTQAVSVYRKLRDRRREAQTLTNIGVLYFALGDAQRAEAYLEKLVPVRRELGDRRGEAMLFNHLAAAQIGKGDHRKALEYLTHAVKLWRELKDPVGEAGALSRMGDVHADSGDESGALSHFQEALGLSTKANHRYLEAYLLTRTGVLLAQKGETSNALARLEQALETFRAIRHRTGEATTLYQIARTELKRNNLQQARERLRPALDIVESLRTGIAGEELRSSYFASILDLYDLEIDLLMRFHQLHPAGNYHVAALETSERARARSLVESLTEAGVDIRQGVEPALVDRERSLQRLLNVKADRLTRLLGGKAAPSEVEQAKEQLEALRTEYQDVRAKIRVTSPRYAALTQPQSLSLREIRQQLLDPDTLLLEYWLGKERSYLWAVTQDDFRAFELPRRAEIETQSRRFHDLLTAPGRRVKFETPEQRRERLARADAQLLHAATALSRVVLGPAADLLKNRRLLVIADGALHYVPFGALQSPTSLDGPATEYQPLSGDHEIVNLPSASALAVMRREFAGRPPAPKMLAVLADPVFDPADERLKPPLSRTRGSRTALRPVANRSAGENPLAGDLMIEDTLTRAVQDFERREEGLRIPRLPFTRREAKSIAALFPPHRRKLFLDFEASRALATSSDLGQYSYVHFATHALVNSVHPELSGVVLSLVDATGHKQDGFLRAHEIFNLNLPAELVVLSGCQTGLGKEIKGEGLIGLTRGFMYAGASRVLVSLWDVHDEATSELMARFYKAMFGEERLRPAAALRSAKAAMWKEKQWRSPYYWAGFVLQGEPE